MNFTITIHAPELTQALNNLADAMRTLSVSGNCFSELVQTGVDVAAATAEAGHMAAASEAAASSEPTIKPETKQTETVDKSTDSTPPITLEQVRAKLAALTQEGKSVKGLFPQFGGKKLSEVSADKYPELLKAAEAIA